MTIRIAVAGCGRLTREVHLPVLARTPGVAVAALADPDAAALAGAARLAPGATLAAGWQDAIAADCDAVLVALPTPLHAEAAAAALAAGRHLYLEKPLAATLDQGRAVLASSRGDRAAMIGFNYRFNPLLQELRRALAAGAVGRLRAIRTTFSTPALPGRSWRHPDHAGGGVLLDLGSHHVDLALYLAGSAPPPAASGPALRVECQRSAREDGSEQATIRLHAGTDVEVEIAVATGTADEDRIEVTGERGALSFDRYRSWSVSRRGPGAAPPSALAARLASLAHWRYALLKRRSPWHEPSHAAALAHFLDAVRHGTAPSPGLEDGWQSLRVVLAAAESAATGHAVDLDAGVHGGSSPACEPRRT